MKEEGFFVKNVDLFSRKIRNNSLICLIKITTRPSFPTVGPPIFYNGYRKVTFEDGWEVKLMKIIAKKLKMIEDYQNIYSMQVKHNSDSTREFERILKMRKTDIAFAAVIPRGTQVFDMTTGYHSDTTAWYVPCGEKFSRWQSIFRMFGISLWLFILVTILLAIFVIILIGKCTQKSRAHKTVEGSFSTNFAIIDGISVPQKPRKIPLRCFFLAWVCYSFAIGTVFQTYLTTFLVDPGMKPHIMNMEELLESGMLLGISDIDVDLYNGSSEPMAEKIMEKRIDCTFNETCYIWASKY